MKLIQTLLKGAHGCAIYESACLGKVHANFALTSNGRVFVQSVHQVGPHSWANLTCILTPQILSNAEAEITAHIKQKMEVAA
jgi:hypothetical protein